MEREGTVREQVFSDYLRRLDSSPEPPAGERVEQVLGSLRGALRSELKRRGLWDRPPSYLGVYGLASWSEAAWTAPFPAGGRSEAWELVIECYKYIFLERYRYLVRHLRNRPDVEGLVYRNVRNFLHDTQKKHDPLGFRVFVMVQAAVLAAMEEGELYLIEGDPRIRNSTVLGFAEATRPSAARELELGEIVRAWNDVLMPDLIVARGKAQDAVMATLRNLLSRLPAEGVEAFRFGDLVELLKNDVRGRWQALFELSQGATAVEEGDEELLRIVRLVGPDTSFEERDAFQKLVDCVSRGISHLEVSPAIRRYLSRLWNFLRIYAAEAEPPPAGRDGADPAAPGLPSHRKLAAELGIPRNRMSDLYGTLGELAGGCRRTLSGPSFALSSAGEGTLEGTLMSDRPQALEKLRLMTAEARRQAAGEEAELSRQAARGPAPGDLFLLPRTAEFGIEWAVLATDPGDRRRLLAVPADPNPLAGSADVAVPRESAGGPLTLRCRFGVWLDRDELEAQTRTAVLDPHFVALAHDKWRQLAEGTLAGTEPEQEADVDPEYRDWAREVLEPARAALGERPQRRGPSSGKVLAFSPVRRRRSLPASSAIATAMKIAASVLLLVTLGLSGLVIRSEQDRRRLIAELNAQSTRVVVNPPRVTFRETALRGEEQSITLSSRSPYLMLVLYSLDRPQDEHRLEIVHDGRDEEIWNGSVPADVTGELRVLLPASRLPAGEYRLLLHAPGDGALVGEYRLSVKVE